jgi:TetR/AcrR family transcriptional repressor of nem operon
MTTLPDTYQRILDSAKELMYASSYADVGVAAICNKAEVKKGSFYHFFPSKQELTLAVIDTYFVELKDGILDRAFDSALPPLERINKFIELAIDMQINIHQQTGHVFGCPFGNLAMELSTQDEKIRTKLDGQFKKFQILLRDTLQEAVANGDLESIDVDATAKAFLAFFEGSMLLAKTHNDPKLLRKLLPAAVQLQL